MKKEEFKILKKETYLRMIENSEGSRVFNSILVEINNTKEIKDILNDGEYSCAVFVSSILTLMGTCMRPHATVNGLEKTLEEKRWEKVSQEDVQPGDIIFWEKNKFSDSTHNRHVGFALSGEEAMSASYEKRVIRRHHITYGVKEGEPVRKIEYILRPVFD